MIQVLEQVFVGFIYLLVDIICVGFGIGEESVVLCCELEDFVDVFVIFICKQFQVFECMLWGDFNKVIVYWFNIVESMVKVYVLVILCKFGVINWVQVILFVGDIDFSVYLCVLKVLE